MSALPTNPILAAPAWHVVRHGDRRISAGFIVEDANGIPLLPPLSTIEPQLQMLY
jgi:hypothetical protein